MLYFLLAGRGHQKIVLVLVLVLVLDLKRCGRNKHSTPGTANAPPAWGATLSGLPQITHDVLFHP